MTNPTGAERLKKSMEKQKSVDEKRFNPEEINVKNKMRLEPEIYEKDDWFDANDRDVWEGKVVRLGASIMPEEDKMLSSMRRKLMIEGVEVSASDLLRAGLRTLNKRDLKSLNNIVAKLPKPKIGRPKTK